MNRMFEIIEDDAIILTDNKGTIIRKVQDNIEDVLVTENNIEEMEKLIDDEERKINRSNNQIKYSKYKLFLAIMWFTILGLNILAQNWFIASLDLLCGSLWTFNYLSVVLPEKKYIKASKNNISILKDNLTLENERLNELNKDKSNDAMYISTGIKHISKSEQIIKLQKKLDTIYMYTIHKNDIIKYYKKGILTEKANKYCWLNNENFYLIEELVKNDISNEKNDVTNEMNPTKVKRK